MLDNLDEHINKQQQTTDEPPAKRIKREEENEVCRSACVKLWRGSMRRNNNEKHEKGERRVRVGVKEEGEGI